MFIILVPKYLENGIFVFFFRLLLGLKSQKYEIFLSKKNVIFLTFDPAWFPHAEPDLQTIIGVW